MPKSKSSSEGGGASDAKKACVCILHNESVEEDTYFIEIKTLSDPAERFRRICFIRDQRLNAPIKHPERLQSVCENIPDQLEDGHGYHLNCYKRFIRNLNRIPTLHDMDINERSNTRHHSPRNTASIADKILFSTDCIFVINLAILISKKNMIIKRKQHLNLSLVEEYMSFNVRKKEGISVFFVV